MIYPIHLGVWTDFEIGTPWASPALSGEESACRCTKLIQEDPTC